MFRGAGTGFENVGGGFEGGEVRAEGGMVGRRGSFSGGGVGGNMFLLIGGSDCWRARLAMSERTRFDAAKETLSRGRGSPRWDSDRLISEPVKPVPVLVGLTEAMRRALPR